MIEPIDLGIAGLTNIERIGSGGNAVVYRARQSDLDRDVVVKVLMSIDAEVTRRRFDRERRAMGRLSQAAGIAPLYGSGFTPNGQPYLLMPFYELGSLQEWIESRGGLPVDQVRHIGVTIGRAVQTAHENGVLHRDLKPANILMSRSGRPDVADFGIAHLVDDAAGTSQALTMTPLYTAPEVFDGIESGAQSDVYSIGATLFALLNGRPAFGDPDGGTPMLSLMRRINEDPLPALPNSVPNSVSKIIAKAMSKEPADRHASAGELAAELAAVDLTAAAVDISDERKRSRVLAYAALAVLVAAVVGATIAFALQRGDGEVAEDRPPTVAPEASTSPTTAVATPTTVTPPTAIVEPGIPFESAAAVAAAKLAVVRIEAFSCTGVEVAQGVVLNDGTIVVPDEVLASPWYIDVIVDGEVLHATPQAADGGFGLGFISVEDTNDLTVLSVIAATEGDRVAIVGIDGRPAEAVITLAESSGLLQAELVSPGEGNAIESADAVLSESGALVGVISVSDGVFDVVTPQEFETGLDLIAPNYSCPRKRRDLAPDEAESAVSPAIQELLTMQQLSDAYASENWELVRKIEPAKTEYERAQFEDGWRPLRQGYIYPVSREVEDQVARWRIGLIGQETWLANDLTTLFCVTWTVDQVSGAVTQTLDDTLRIYGSQEGEEKQIGIVDPGEMRELINQSC